MSEETPRPPGEQSPADEQEQPWAARLGLVRPREGRYLAGVCAAVGRATNTDPLLWRVIVGVLAVFGVGIVLYLAGWLLMPAEGDTASPLEALFGRGFSTTSTALTLVLSVIAVILLGALTNSFLVSLIAAIGLVVVALAANPGQRGRPPAPAWIEPPTQADGAPTVVTHGVPAGSYQPPFAPHGPYASPPPLVLPKLPKPLKPKREPSRLGRLIFGVALIVLGVLGVADLTGVSMPASAYLAAALGVVGAGLIIGAWLGRARGYILIGIALALALPIAADEEHRDRSGRTGSVLWTPNTVDEIAGDYDHRFGEATLDLTNVDFTGRDVRIDAAIAFGGLTIYLPEDVDVIVESDVNLGDANLFGHSINGPGMQHTTRDDGPDGAGGGTLRLSLKVKFAHAEVTR